MDETNITKNSYLSFGLSNEMFAVSIYKVLEVLLKQRITEVPNAPETIRGVINFRGEILPIVRLRKKLSMPDRDDNLKYVIIVLELQIENKTVKIGAMADNVKDVIEINEDELHDIPTDGINYDTKFIEAMKKSDEGFIIILDIEKIFSSKKESDELKQTIQEPVAD